MLKNYAVSQDNEQTFLKKKKVEAAEPVKMNI